MVTAIIQSNYFREYLAQYDCSVSYSFLTPTNTISEIVDVALKILESNYRQGIYYKRAGIHNGCEGIVGRCCTAGRV